MSVPNLTNNMIQPQNIVINQVPLTHTILTNVNANNGIPIATAIQHAPLQVPVEQSPEIKQNMVVETIPIAGNNLVGVQTVPVQNPSPVTNTNNVNINPKPPIQNNVNVEPAQVLTKQRLQDLVRDTDSTLTLEDEVEEIILKYVDEFVERCLNGASMIAKNRQVNTIEVKDVQQFLNRNYNMWTPGLGTAELRPYKRSLTTEAHKQRLALIRKTLKKY